MKIDVDTKQRIQSSCLFLLEFYKVLMGSFLVLFVPQQCGDHICTFKEIIENETPCVAVNTLSCLYLLYLYSIELKRENWCIKYLDIDPNKPNNNLDTEIEQYPEYKNNMLQINKKYKKNSLNCIGLQGVNITLSVVYIAHHWTGTIALTPLISYVIMVISKLYNTFFISNASIKEERAYSAYLTISKTYNTIDSDLVDQTSI
jgi:hypothetical protein